ncbi:uncharacterized protein [Musca autumnalis]|uniref:uncharacterized protein n=1 Tax=Musca autumnalis TaxID=221902 RepID=UPI003CF50688
MKFKNLLIVVILLACVFVCHAVTFKPFVRSRYSLRWRKTTETSKLWESTTSSPKLETVAAPTMNSVENVKNLVETSTTPSAGIVKTSSTHPPDYDYYGNNEIEDNDHPQNSSN